MRHTLPLALLGILTGCSGTTISGEVDGTPVGGTRSAVFDKVEFGVFGFTIDATFLLLTDIPNACEVLEDFTRVRDDDCVDTCTDLNAIATDQLGKDDYWLNIVVLNPYEDDVGTYALDRDFDDEGDFTSAFSALDMSDLYDTDACEDECDAGNEVLGTSDEDATNGTVTVDSFENNVALKGELDLSFPADETIAGKFTAEHCNLEAFIEGLAF